MLMHRIGRRLLIYGQWQMMPTVLHLISIDVWFICRNCHFFAITYLRLVFINHHCLALAAWPVNVVIVIMLWVLCLFVFATKRWTRLIRQLWRHPYFLRIVWVTCIVNWIINLQITHLTISAIWLLELLHVGIRMIVTLLLLTLHALLQMILFELLSGTVHTILRWSIGLIHLRYHIELTLRHQGLSIIAAV